jgi:hypothetical protein
MQLAVAAIEVGATQARLSLQKTGSAAGFGHVRKTPRFEAPAASAGHGTWINTTIIP